MTGHIRLAVAFTFAFVLAGCGVHAERDPRPITLDAGPTGSASGPGSAARSR